jgi:hypothetical protein
MNPFDQDVADSDPTISSRPPYLPPITPKQAMDALFSPASLNYALLHDLPQSHGLGLAQVLTYGTPQRTSLYQGLAKDLQDHGITSWPGADPRLLNVTTDPKAPAFQTAGGTTIQMNKPSPYTTLPWGQGLDRMIKFADGTGAKTVTITGGTEGTVRMPDGNLKDLHSANSLHSRNQAIDMRPDTNISDDTLKQAALNAGFTHGMHEIKGDGIHLHFQVGPDNILGNPDVYDLRNPGPIGLKDYTKIEKPDDQAAGNGGP